MMQLWEISARFAFYVVTQGGSFDKANTIYFWPCVSLTQEQKGIPMPNGKTYHWLLTAFFLFWTIGIVYAIAEEKK